MPTAPPGGGGFDVLQSLQNAFTTLMSYVPNIIGALLVLLIGYIIARLIRAGITKLLRRVRLDERLTHGRGGEYVARFSPDGSPAKLVGLVVQWVLLVFVIVSAIGTLNIPAVTGFMNLVLSYLPNVLAAMLIFLVAAAVAAAVGGLVHRTMGDTPTGRVVRSAAPTLVMAIAVFMILTQLNIAPVIVTATYIALIGAIALGSALAFGLGGRDAAADLINSGYRRAQQQSDQVRRDMQVGRERGEAEARAYAPDEFQGAGRGDGAPGAHEAAAPHAAPSAPTTRVDSPGAPTPPDGTPRVPGDPYATPGDPYAQPGATQPGATQPPTTAGPPARPGDPYGPTGGDPHPGATEPVSPSTPPRGTPPR